MLVFQKIRARCGLFRSAAGQWLQWQAASRCADTLPGVTLARVRLSSVGVSLARSTLPGEREPGGGR